MRALLAALVCIVVLLGSAAFSAQHVDMSIANDIAFRARAAKALADESGKDCGCTGPTRAKDRAASQDTTTTGSDN